MEFIYSSSFPNFRGFIDLAYRASRDGRQSANDWRPNKAVRRTPVFLAALEVRLIVARLDIGAFDRCIPQTHRALASVIPFCIDDLIIVIFR